MPISFSFRSDILGQCIISAGKEIGRRWQAMAPEEKQIYHEKYQELKVEFDNAMKDYETSEEFLATKKQSQGMKNACLLYTSDAADE